MTNYTGRPARTATTPRSTACRLPRLTDANGYYAFEKGYPMGSWMVLEAYSDLYRTTGVTYQASNSPSRPRSWGRSSTSACCPSSARRGRLDWGVKFYERH